MERYGAAQQSRAELVYGAGMTVSGIALAALPALAAERVLRGRGQPQGLPLRILATAALLKMTFAWRGLIRAGESVQRDLETRATDDARDDLRALVSRDTRELDASQLSAAAIESLAEERERFVRRAIILLSPLWLARRGCVPRGQHVGLDDRLSTGGTNFSASCCAVGRRAQFRPRVSPRSCSCSPRA